MLFYKWLQLKTYAAKVTNYRFVCLYCCWQNGKVQNLISFRIGSRSNRPIKGNVSFSSSPKRAASASVRVQGNSSSESEEEGVRGEERAGASVFNTLGGISSSSDGWTFLTAAWGVRRGRLWPEAVASTGKYGCNEMAWQQSSWALHTESRWRVCKL